MEIALPAVVQQRADAVFEQIQREHTGKRRKEDTKKHVGNRGGSDAGAEYSDCVRSGVYELEQRYGRTI